MHLMQINPTVGSLGTGRATTDETTRLLQSMTNSAIVSLHMFLYSARPTDESLFRHSPPGPSRNMTYCRSSPVRLDHLNALS